MNAADKNKIAVFDFDGTIAKKDTFFDFILYSTSFWRLFCGVLKSLPVLFLYILRVFSDSVAKEKIFSNFFKGTEKETFGQLCKSYSLNCLPKILRPEALGKIKWHKEQGHILIIASASIEDWIKPWAEQAGFGNVIATIPKFENRLTTGKFKTKNCNREEKLKRFLAEYPNREGYYLYVYSDSRKDNWLFNIADEKFYRRF